MFEIRFYSTNSERERLDKVLSGGRVLTGTFRENCSVSNPIFIVEGENFSDYNYMYVASFKRYYYITDVVSIRNNIWEIHAHTDVLMSFKDYIKASYGLINETQVTEASNYLNSDSWVSDVRRTTDVISFENGFDDNGHYILITAGGV